MAWIVFFLIVAVGSAIIKARPGSEYGPRAHDGRGSVIGTIALIVVLIMMLSVAMR